MADGFGKVACGAESISGRSVPSSDLDSRSRLDRLLLPCTVLGYAVVIVTQVATLFLCPGYPVKKDCAGSFEEPMSARELDALSAQGLPYKHSLATIEFHDHDTKVKVDPAHPRGERSP